MNTNNVISGIAAEDLAGKEGRSVKLTSTGLALAGAADLVVAIIVRAAVGIGVAVDLFLAGKFNGLHYIAIGDNTAIAIGDQLEQTASGQFVKRVAKSITAATTDIITSAAHGWADGVPVIFPALTGGAGLTALAPVYFVRDSTTDTFKVAATPGGVAVDITSAVTAGTVQRADYQALAWEAAPSSSSGGQIRALLF